ncbi:hypothetical protein Bca52824_067132 [Brassica carinata]|uniref:F-box domain-containing protein n=1 Tax=Brassica carinata TaxID=52824 RepID=A0A8X7QN51_BRACI|nr:hypothetical protein Bca52824_067132 [Brassica carinata]
MSLPDLPDDVLAIIFGKVGESSYEDYAGCMLSCKTFQRLSKYPEVLQKLDLTKAFPPPWERIPNASNILYECAQFRNITILLNQELLELITLNQRQMPDIMAMYLYGMALINEKQLAEGAKYIKMLWTKRGFEAVWQCLENCSRVVQEMSIREYRGYEMLVSQIEVGDEGVVGQFEVVGDEWHNVLI